MKEKFLKLLNENETAICVKSKGCEFYYIRLGINGKSESRGFEVGNTRIEAWKLAYNELSKERSC